MINLNEVSYGTILESVHGSYFMYLEKTDYDYPHKVLALDTEFSHGYLPNPICTRIDDGHVYLHNRLESDHDIAKVLSEAEALEVIPKFALGLLRDYARKYIDCIDTCI